MQNLNSKQVRKIGLIIFAFGLFYAAFEILKISGAIKGTFSMTSNTFANFRTGIIFILCIAFGVFVLPRLLRSTSALDQMDEEKVEQELGEIIKEEKKNSIPSWVTIVILIVIGMYTWWSLSPRGLILGKWNNSVETIEVFSSGTFIINGIAGSYQLLDGHRARVELGGLGVFAGAQVINYEVSLDKLILSDGRSSKTYKRNSSPSLIVIFYQAIKGQ